MLELSGFFVMEGSEMSRPCSTFRPREVAMLVSTEETMTVCANCGCLPHDSVMKPKMVAIDASTRLALKEAVERFTESSEEWGALVGNVLDERARNQAIRGATKDRHTAAVLERLLGEGE